MKKNSFDHLSEKDMSLIKDIISNSFTREKTEEMPRELKYILAVVITSIVLHLLLGAEKAAKAADILVIIIGIFLIFGSLADTWIQTAKKLHK